MLKVNLDRSTGIAILEPVGELTASDFSAAAETIDPYIRRNR